MVWDNAPISVALGVGAEFERLLVFPTTMRIGVPASIASLVRVETTGRKTYVTAFAPFAKTRLHAEDPNSGSVILLDFSASPATIATAPIEIVTPAEEVDTHASSASAGAGPVPPPDMATLTRFAARQVYAPRRLAMTHPAIHPIAVSRAPVDGLYRGALMRATPMGAWRGDDLYVTAVLLQNEQASAIELHPQQVRGAWRAITFQHGRLLPRGSEADTTVVYLVCERRFEACR